MAVGNPLGLASTVTTGIVSAVDRPVSTSGENGSEATVTNAIQVDAAVNPGNSGGPLFDAPAASSASTRRSPRCRSESGSIGLGFAIPVDLVKNIAAQLVEDGTAEHAFLGVSPRPTAPRPPTASPAAARSSSRSATARRPRRPSIQVDDTIVAIDGKAVGGAESLTAYVRALAVRHEGHADGRPRRQGVEVDVTLAVRPRDRVDARQPAGSGPAGAGPAGARPAGARPGSAGRRQRPGRPRPPERHEPRRSCGSGSSSSRAARAEPAPSTAGPRTAHRGSRPSAPGSRTRPSASQRLTPLSRATAVRHGPHRPDRHPRGSGRDPSARVTLGDQRAGRPGRARSASGRAWPRTPRARRPGRTRRRCRSRRTGGRAAGRRGRSCAERSAMPHSPSPSAPNQPTGPAYRARSMPSMLRISSRAATVGVPQTAAVGCSAAASASDDGSRAVGRREDAGDVRGEVQHVGQVQHERARPGTFVDEQNGSSACATDCTAYSCSSRSFDECARIAARARSASSSPVRRMVPASTREVTSPFSERTSSSGVAPTRPSTLNVQHDWYCVREPLERPPHVDGVLGARVHVAREDDLLHVTGPDGGDALRDDVAPVVRADGVVGVGRRRRGRSGRRVGR